MGRGHCAGHQLGLRPALLLSELVSFTEKRRGLGGLRRAEDPTGTIFSMMPFIHETERHREAR